MNPTNTNSVSTQTLQGILYSRIFGTLCGFGLIGLGMARITTEQHPVAPNWFIVSSGMLWLTLGLFLTLPWKKISQISNKTWKILFSCLIILSTAFVFTMIVKIMYDYVEASQQQLRLGVPGFEGTLIFVALIQVPTILFVRKPTLLA